MEFYLLVTSWANYSSPSISISRWLQLEGYQGQDDEEGGENHFEGMLVWILSPNNMFLQFKNCSRCLRDLTLYLETVQIAVKYYTMLHNGLKIGNRSLGSRHIPINRGYFGGIHDG